MVIPCANSSGGMYFGKRDSILFRIPLSNGEAVTRKMLQPFPFMLWIKKKIWELHVFNRIIWQLPNN